MKKMGLLLLAALVVSPLIHSQTHSQTTSPPAPMQIVALGSSAVTLTGWKFAPGDSRWENGQPLWASPAFDDAQWAGMDLRSANGELDPAYGNAGYLTGWTVRGFPRLWGYAWYRLRLHVASAQGSLWIKMPDHVDDSYQLYANGQYVGQFGRFLKTGVKCYRSRPLIFKLPSPDEHGDILLAIRFYMEPWGLIGGVTGDSGGMHQAPVLGTESQIDLLQKQADATRILGQVLSVFVGFLVLIAAAGAFRLWLLDRPRATYLWLTFGLLFAAVSIALLIVSLFTYAYTQDTLAAISPICFSLGLVCWIFFWRQWFALEPSSGLNLLIIAAAAADCVANTVFWMYLPPSIPFFAYVFWMYLPPSIPFFAYKVSAAADIVLGLVLFLTLAQGARKDRMGALAALPPVILVAISAFSSQLMNWFHIRTSFFPFGVAVSITDVAMLLLVLVIGVLAARRFLHSQVRQQLERQTVQQELEQASELQQHVLLPETVTSPAFEVETAYRPAQTVGGDFFQALTRPDGTLLAVIGDVSGKGVSAAMLVAVLVGAIRSQAEYSFDPQSMLAMLNRRLIGRSGGHFATCLAAEIRPDGVVRIANAGHLPPYLNGKEVELEGSLPLGIVDNAEYPVQTFALKPDDRLTFMTDGVVEATNEAKELFGFERTQAISRESAAAIVEQAQIFGQKDDITALSVHFVGAPATA